jgi:hypothetical protein
MVQALPFLAAAGSMVKGVGGLMAGNENRRSAYAQAGEERRAAAGQIRRVKTDARRKIGEQLTMMAGGGFEGASAGGTALDALRESQVEAAMDVLELRRQGVLRSRALERQGDNARREGRFALVSGILGAGSSYIQGKNDWAQARAGEGG